MESETRLWWCPRCGMVWTAALAPLCRHHDPDLPAAEMEPLPDWYPFVMTRPSPGGKS